jgi:hypothetical protein
VVIQGDALNRSRMATVVCVAITSNLKNEQPEVGIGAGKRSSR